MLVNDCGEMTTECASTLGKRFYPGPSEGVGASTPTMYGTQGTDFAPLQSMGSSTPTTYGVQEFYSKSIGVLTPTTY